MDEESDSPVVITYPTGETEQFRLEHVVWRGDRCVMTLIPVETDDGHS